MKALEQFFHFCIVCWTISGMGAINTALRLPPNEYKEIFYFIIFMVLGVLGKQISAVLYYRVKSYSAIIISACFYSIITLGLFFTNQIFIGFFIFFISLIVIDKLLSKNKLKWQSILTIRFYYRFYLELKKSFKI